MGTLRCLLFGHDWEEVLVYWSATLSGRPFGSGCDAVKICTRCKAKR